MSTDFFGADAAKTYVDFLVQIGVLIGFGAGAIGFIYKVITGRLDKAIDTKIEPLKQTQEKIVTKIQDIQDDLDRNAKNKEELDRERFRNVADSQNFIKDSIKTSIDDVGEIKKKLDAHLLDAASFISQTNEKINQINKAMDDFRSFMMRVESR